LFGHVAVAVAMAERSVALADRADDAFDMVFNRAIQAEALLAAGDREKAAGLFADSERRQRERQPEYPLLYGFQGYCYCDLLLSLGRAADARPRVNQTLEWTRKSGDLLSVALDTLTLGRTDLVLALHDLVGRASTAPASAGARAAAAELDHAIEGLRAAGQGDSVPRGLLARAAFRRAVGEWEGAKRDLDEAEEIAEPGPMRLYLCDCSLEHARLALARREAFAPLNGLVEPSPAPPALPDGAATAGFSVEARVQLDAARKLIVECGYHRRDEELSELDEVVAGRRRFADLPPRV
jgi:hypothetical protein